MAITRDSTMTLDKLGTRVRLLTGIESAEVDDSDLSVLVTMAIEWVEEQEGTSFTVNTNDLVDQAVCYYTSYLLCIAQNGMGVEDMKIGDIFMSYTKDDPYGKFLDMANEALLQKNALSIKTSTYNADPQLGDIDWKKNIDGSDSTLNVRKRPRNIG
jgi:hypothetical protein|tara:strand:+ start:951 stop:1421 length:471 start_codon:yes stop_codon:yes gene_type:complete